MCVKLTKLTNTSQYLRKKARRIAVEFETGLNDTASYRTPWALFKKSSDWKCEMCLKQTAGGGGLFCYYV